MRTGTARSPLGVALVGCGAVAERYYAPALRELVRHEMVTVRALYDPQPARVAALRRSFPAALPIGSLDDLPGLDVRLGIVASPPRHHAAQTLALLEQHVAVLCEKPLATTVADASAMIAAAAASGVLLAPGLLRRFFPATRAIREILALGVVGAVQSIRCFEGGAFSWPTRSPGFFERTGTHGGGVLLDVGVHVLDLLIWWLGEPTEVHYEDDAMGGVEANCRLRLRFAPDVQAEVRLSRDWFRPNRYVIRGARGWLGWEANDAGELTLGLRDGPTLTARAEPGERARGSTPTFEQSFLAQLVNVVAAIRGTAPLVVPGEAALPSLAVIERCYRQRSLMSMPWLSAHEMRRGTQLAGPSSAPGRP